MLIYQKTLQRYYFYFEKANFSKDFYFRKVIFAHFFTFAKVNRSNPLCQRSFDASFKCRICTIFSPSSVSGTTIIYFWYFYSFSIHFHDHLASILNVTVGFLSLLYLVLFSFDFGVIGFCPYYVLILSYFYAGYYLFPIFTCSFSD